MKSFILSTPQQSGTQRRTVLVTGARGRIGSYFAQYAAEKYDLILMVRPAHNEEGLSRFGKIVKADLLQLEKLKRFFQGVDTIVHLAANPDEKATWGELIDSNIVGLYHTFAAAVEAHCRRVVFASSIHAVSGYPLEHQVHTDDPVSPGDLYGVTKCFGEALGRFFATSSDLSVICIRIGSFQPVERIGESSSRIMRTFISHRDLAQLITRCIDDVHVKFAIVHGLSDNGFLNRMDISETRELFGYLPQDRGKEDAF